MSGVFIDSHGRVFFKQSISILYCAFYLMKSNKITAPWLSR